MLIGHADFNTIASLLRSALFALIRTRALRTVLSEKKSRMALKPAAPFTS
jgi:hypothetical protein